MCEFLKIEDISARVAIKSQSTLGWRNYSGLSGDGEGIGMRTFDESGKLKDLLQEFHLEIDSIVKKSNSLLLKKKNKFYENWYCIRSWWV